MANFEITWDSPEFEYRDKDVSWYWISIITAACIIAFAVWVRNFLFGFFVVIAEILFIVWGSREPRIIEFQINEQNLVIGGGRSYALKEFEAWSADEIDDDWVELYFYFRSRVKPTLKILMPIDQLEDLRTNLKPILKEIDHQPTFLDAIEKFLRF